MESGKLSTLSFIAVMVMLVFVVIQVWQKDSIERAVRDNTKGIEKVGGETEKLGRALNRLQILENQLHDAMKKLDGIQENAMRLERLSGQVDTLAKVKGGTPMPIYIPAGGAATPPAVPNPGDGGAEQPRFGEEDPDRPGPTSSSGSKDVTRPTDPAPPGPERTSSELAEFNAWKETLVGRQLTQEEIDKIWQPDAKGVIRPVAPMDDTWRDPMRDGGLIRRSLGTDPKGFNPLTENSADVSEIYSYCLGSLCKRRLKDPNVWEFDMAESAEISNDFKVYTFRLRKGLKWQKPAVNLNDPQYSWLRDMDREVTAEDFKFYLDMALNPQVQCEHMRNYFQDVDRVEVIDRYAFRIVWKKKTYNSLSFSLGLAPLCKFLYTRDEDGEPFPQETLGKDFNEHWYNNMVLGCGPYNFAQWRESEKVVLERNSEYHGALPHIEKIDFLIIRDDEAAFLKLQSPNPNDRLDFWHIRRTHYKKYYREPMEEGRTPMFHLKDDPAQEGQDLTLDFYTSLGYSYIGWNLEKDLFQDKRVRQAMTHAFPRQRVLDTIYEGLGDVVSGNFYMHGPDYNKNILPLPFDLDASKRLLAEAGWADLDGNGVLEKNLGGELKEFRFRLYIWANSAAVANMANIFKEELRKVGVIVDVAPLDWALFQQKMQNREFDAYTGAWALSWESDPYQIWHSSQADTPKSSNFVSFRNAECDRIIETARSTFDPAKRRELFHRFHEIVNDEQPYTFLFCTKALPVWWPHVKPEFYPNRPQALGHRWYIQK